tara:strand:- start:567 stop:872 length:306 start_codon:yes stop_codon:yes gene_type:complete
MADYQEDAFTLFTNFNRSKLPGKENEYWSKAEWSLAEIRKLYEWSISPQTDLVQNQRGETCVTVYQKLLPKKSKAGNDYLLGVTSGAYPKKDEAPSTAHLI